MANFGFDGTLNVQRERSNFGFDGTLNVQRERSKALKGVPRTLSCNLKVLRPLVELLFSSSIQGLLTPLIL
eukprot:jgi/Botrbrau1/22336/Bobra.0002s0015.1